MIDYSTLQDLEIPEGKVVQFDIDGVTLWKSGPPMVTVNLESIASQTRTYMYIDGVQRYQGTFDVPVGTILYCDIYEEGSKQLEDVRVNIYLNGISVASDKFSGRGTDKLTYNHTITTNTTVTKEFTAYSKCNIYIVES